MATIIVFSDIHGNLAGLEAAWRDIRDRPYEALYCLGDLAAFGPKPEECITFIREEIQPTATILGNTDRYLLEESWKKKGAADDELQASLRWTREQLSDASYQWLSDLPPVSRHTVSGVDIELVHGAPGNDELGIGPGVDPKVVDRLFADHGPGLTFCGHTHVPFRVNTGKRQVANVGSIGFPFDGDRRSAYARVIIADGEVREVDFRRVNFNSDRVISQLEDSGMPAATLSIRRLRFAEKDFPTPDRG